VHYRKRRRKLVHHQLRHICQTSTSCSNFISFIAVCRLRAQRTSTQLNGSRGFSFAAQTVWSSPAQLRLSGFLPSRPTDFQETCKVVVIHQCILLTYCQIRAVRWTKCLAQSVNWRLSRCKFLCFWRTAVWEGAPSCCSERNGHISPWCRVASLCQAVHHVTCVELSAWLNENDFCIALAQHSDGHHSTAAGIGLFALALSDFWRWCFSWEQLMSKCGHSYVIIINKKVK